MLNAKPLLALLPIALLSLTGCGTASSDAAQICPVPVEYSREFQSALAEEIASLPMGSSIERAIIDYGRLRAELRACRGN